jgi:GT2 family glycosyltransferase
MTSQSLAETSRALVVIPCLNESRTIVPLLQQLIDNLPSPDCLVVVVDGGSTDDTLMLARGFERRNSRVKVLCNPLRLQSSSINLAVDTFGRDFDCLIRVDAHGSYPSDYCASLLSEAHASGASSVVVSMFGEGKTCFQRAAALAQNSVLGNGGSPHRNAVGEGRWIEHGHHALIRISAFREVGGYDPSFSHNEDAEFDVRMGKGGHRIWLSGRADMIYFPRSSISALLRQYVNYGRGRARNALKHRRKPGMRQLVPLSVVPCLVIGLLGIRWPILALPALCWITACLSVGAVLGIRSGDLCAAGSGIPAMTMHLGWSWGFISELVRSLNPLRSFGAGKRR